MSSLRPGDTVQAAVVRVEPYGLRLQHEEHEILVLLPELTWSSGSGTLGGFEPGDSVRVRVLRFDPNARHYMGSVRRVSDERNPYRELAQAPEGQLFHGRVQVVLGEFVSIVLTNPLALVYSTVPAGTDAISSGDDVDVVMVHVDPDDGQARVRIVDARA